MRIRPRDAGSSCCASRGAGAPPPAGALPTVVNPHSIDDVPVLTLTLHSSSYDVNMLRQIGLAIGVAILIAVLGSPRSPAARSAWPQSPRTADRAQQ